MTDQNFCLQWNDFENTISTAFRELREGKNLFDVTLACDDQQIQAHKVVLSACSPFFLAVLARNPHPHPLIYIKGVNLSNLEYVLNFMYYGKISITQGELQTFLAVAEDLQVKGLTPNYEHWSSNNTSQIKDPVYNKEQWRSNIINHNPTLYESSSKSAPLFKPSTVTDSMPQGSPTDINDGQNIILPVKTEQETYQSVPAASHTLAEQEEHPQECEGEEAQEYNGLYGVEEGMVMGIKFWSADHDKVDEKIAEMIRQCPEGGYLCQVCGYINGRRQNLKKHVEKHIETPRYPCYFCQQQFKTRNSLNTHVSTRHRDERKKHH